MNRDIVSTIQETPFQAVIADMDSVLTRMASMHERAWKEMFDLYLKEHGRQENSRQEQSREAGTQQAEFSHADYRKYLDGKLRYPGLAEFLASRHIKLPWGDVNDAPQVETICGLGNRKEQILIKLLDREGVAVFEDALDSLRRWRLGGLKLAATSASCNCRNVLRVIELENYLDVIVDGELARELGLKDKGDLMQEAARQLAVDPANVIVLEDAAAGIRAGKACGFGAVIGVNRNHHAAELENAGADAVIKRLTALRFSRHLPSALDNLDAIASRQADAPLAVFLDFDGTLAPLVDDPREAVISEAMLETVKSLTGSCTLGIISGRDREDLQARVAIEGILYAGSHGLDIAGPGYQTSLPEAEAAIPEVDSAENRLREALEAVPGVVIERKRFAVAVHYRKVRSDVAIQQVKRVVDGVLADTHLRKRLGKKVLELEPAVDWDKGHAVEWLMETAEIDPRRVLVIYIGDDETDEDVFAALAGKGLGVRVGEEISTSLADYYLAEPTEVQTLLQRIGERCR
ncbi:MAG: trehalose-phosphatase [Cellvibrionaceae bacterium]